MKWKIGYRTDSKKWQYTIQHGDYLAISKEIESLLIMGYNHLSIKKVEVDLNYDNKNC